MRFAREDISCRQGNSSWSPWRTTSALEVSMPVVELGGSTYAVDEDGFLADPCLWNKDFASAMAPKLGISEELTDLHWEILAFIRDFYLSTGKCPTVHKTCRIHNLRSADLERLFPCGYRRGRVNLPAYHSALQSLALHAFPNKGRQKHPFVLKKGFTMLM